MGDSRASDSDSNEEGSGLNRGGAGHEYEISEEIRLARERQEKAVQELLMKRHTAALAVPTNDNAVRARLRSLEIAKYSIVKSALRLHRARRKRVDPDDDLGAEIDCFSKQAANSVLESSEIGDDRTLSGCLLSHDGKMLATCKTTVKQIEKTPFTAREDIAIILISQYVANIIRFLVDKPMKYRFSNEFVTSDMRRKYLLYLLNNS
ncbi:hypothetical protein OROMI_003377 [Orobanche minor]